MAMSEFHISLVHQPRFYRGRCSYTNWLGELSNGPDKIGAH